MVVTAQIHGHSVRALIDSGATRCFISLSAVIPLGLTTITYYTLGELGDGHKTLSKGKVVDIPIMIVDLAVKINFMFTFPLLHDMDLILGVN